VRDLRNQHVVGALGADGHVPSQGECAWCGEECWSRTTMVLPPETPWRVSRSIPMHIACTSDMRAAYRVLNEVGWEQAMKDNPTKAQELMDGMRRLAAYMGMDMPKPVSGGSLPGGAE